MLQQKNRIRKKKEIEEIFKKGKGFKQDFLILKTNKNNLDTCRFAFIVSKKISKKAVIRNKIKRRLREAVRLKIKELKPGFDNLFIALHEIETKDFKEIQEAIEKLFKKSDLLE